MDSHTIVQIEANRLVDIIQNANGFFSVTFFRKDGTMRKINARMDVVKGVKGTAKYDVVSVDEKNGNIRIWDKKAGHHKCIKKDLIFSVTTSGKEYRGIL